VSTSAVAYKGSPATLVTSALLWSDGALGQTSLSVDSTHGNSNNFDSGVVYVIVEQAGSTGGVANPSQVAGLLSSQSNLSPATAKANNFTYQLFETTLTGSPDDLGDISSVNTFGLASTLEVVINPGPDQTTDTRGFLSNGSVIFNATNVLTANTGVQTFDPDVFPSSALAVGAAAANNAAPWASSLWTQYIANLKTYSELAAIELVTSGHHTFPTTDWSTSPATPTAVTTSGLRPDRAARIPIGAGSRRPTSSSPSGTRMRCRFECTTSTRMWSRTLRSIPRP